jgi:hypothetical protein
MRQRLDMLIDEKVHDRQSRCPGCANQSPASRQPRRNSRRSR